MTDAPDSLATPSSGPGSPASPGRTDVFAAIRSTGIVRGRDRWLTGGYGGLAVRAGLNPVPGRVLTVVLGILGGPVLFAYAVGWSLLPDATGRIPAEQAVRGVVELAMIGVIWLMVILARRAAVPAGGRPPAVGTAGSRATTVTAGGSAGPSPGRGSWRDRRPGAGFSAIVLGLALLCGAVAAGLRSGGSWSDAALLVGLSVTLGVLALGIIVAGLRGKQSGAVGGFAFLTAIGLVFLGLFPGGTVFFPVGAPVWTVSADAGSTPPGYAVLAGRATIDLTALDAAGAEERTIDVWMGVGVTELILPRDRPVQVETQTLAGGIDYVGGESTVQQGGVVFSDGRIFSDDGTRVVARIRVWTVLGQVTVVGPSPLEPS